MDIVHGIFRNLYASMAHKPVLFRCPCTHVSANVTILNFEALYRLWIQLYTNYQIPEIQNVWWYILSIFSHYSYENMAHDLGFLGTILHMYQEISPFSISRLLQCCTD